MKKLMIAAAVAALAIGAQAAITYQMTTGYKGGELSDDTIGYYTLYARAAENTRFGSSAKDIEDYFSKEVAAGNWESVKADWQSSTPDPQKDVTRGAGHVFANKKIVDSALTFDRASSEEQFNYFAVIFYQNGETEGYRVVQAENKGSSTPITIAEGTNGTWREWQTVPEPTSGLLLLLGVAGLALKRKRA